MKFLGKLKTVNLKAFSFIGFCMAAAVSMLPSQAQAQVATAPTLDEMADSIDMFATVTSFTDRLAPVYQWAISLALVAILIGLVIKFGRRST